MTELKDNSITVFGNVINSTEKTVNEDQVVEIKVRIPAKELDGKRDAFAKVLKANAKMVFVPSQTELDVDGNKPADGQTELLDEKPAKPAAAKPAPKAATKTAAKTAAKVVAKTTVKPAAKAGAKK